MLYCRSSGGPDLARIAARPPRGRSGFDLQQRSPVRPRICLKCRRRWLNTGNWRMPAGRAGRAQVSPVISLLLKRGGPCYPCCCDFPTFSFDRRRPDMSYCWRVPSRYCEPPLADGNLASRRRAAGGAAQLRWSSGQFNGSQAGWGAAAVEALNNRVRNPPHCMDRCRGRRVRLAACGLCRAISCRRRPDPARRCRSAVMRRGSRVRIWY